MNPFLFNPFHVIAILAIVVITIMTTVGDDFRAMIKSRLGFADPMERELMAICERARRI